MKTLFSVYGRSLRTHRAKILLFLLLSVAHKAVSILTPMVTQRLVDSAVYPAADQAAAFLRAVIQNAALFVLFILLLCLRYHTKNIIELDAEARKKSEILQSIPRKTNAALAQKPPGSLLQLVSRDVEKSIGLIVYDVSVLALNIVYVAAVFWLLLRYSIPLTAISGLLIPLFVLFSKIMLPKIEKVNDALNRARDAVGSLTEEAYHGAESIKCGNAHAFFHDRVKQRIDLYKKLSMQNAKLDILYDFVMVTGVMNAGNVIVYLAGAFLIMRGRMTAGQMTGFALYFSSLWGIVEGFMSFFKQYKVKRLSLKRIEEFERLPLEDERPEGLKADAVESLSLCDVSLSFGEKSVLKNCCLTIRKGEHVLLTGANGSGKSTIAKLFSGMLEPDGGAVLLNGRPLSDYSLYALRQKVRFIPAAPYLFEGTVADNLQGMTVDAGLLPDLPLCRQVDAAGANLSGGEKKLIQLCLGLSCGADCYILDEPLNYIDREAVDRVLAFIRRAFRHKTLLVISHQQGLFDDSAYRTVTLRDGKITE